MVEMNADTDWPALYRGAILEPDPKQMQSRIAKAQCAIRHRAQELWYTGAPDTTELRRMDTAAHFLSILAAIGARGTQ